MGGVFVNSSSQATVHGVYGIEAAVPAIVVPTGTGVAGMVGQFPWGPDGTLEIQATPAEFIQKFSPAGMSRSSTGYNATRRKSFPELRVVRAIGSAAAKATATLVNVSTDIVDLELKYKGVAGNSVTYAVTAATDGDANHFNLTINVTGESGTTTDTLQNLNYSGTGADSAPNLANCYLLGSITKVTAGRPTNIAATAFTGGADGTINALAYTGTAGSGDHGIAALENDGGIRHVFTDDCGSAIRAAVTAALQAHVESMGDRLAYIDGPTGESIAAAKTNASSYRSDRVVYCDPWVKQFDDTGALIEVPPSSYVASVASRLSPSTSPAWKGTEVVQMFSGIQGLVSHRGVGRANLADNGIASIFKRPNGGYSLEAGITTIAPLNQAIKLITRRRMTDYIVVNGAEALSEYIDAPNTEETRDNAQLTLSQWLESLKTNATIDQLHLPFIVDYQMVSLDSVNSFTTVAQGYVYIPFLAQTAPDASYIFLIAKVGPTVEIEEQA